MDETEVEEARCAVVMMQKCLLGSKAQRPRSSAVETIPQGQPVSSYEEIAALVVR